MLPAMILAPLPIDDALPELRAVLSRRGNAVLQAPPGAGKTTGVPLALLDQDWLRGGKILMLEPRRLAARAAARRMAGMLGENTGDTVGYRVRLEAKISARTRIEVVTEGILIRRLQHDPALEGVGLVIFDEFHERSLDADLGLALCLEAQGALRDDLKILVMSATLDGETVANLMDNAPVVSSAGRAYPVVTHYLEKTSAEPVEKQVCRACLTALHAESGNILVFLPGAGEIRRVQSLLQASALPPKLIIAPLYGNLTPQEQDLAIAPPPRGARKIVLATSIAETSLTIEGIRVVIDSGLMRGPCFDPRAGMTRLLTRQVSAASADQRRGRAGRLEPGVCYRLWTKAADRALIPFTNPEILDADLTALALELTLWGASDGAGLKWLTPPPSAGMQQARALLQALGALDHDHRVTPHGRKMAELPLHPRLAHLVLRAAELGYAPEGARLAALLEERPIIKSDHKTPDADIHRQCQILDDVSRGLKPSEAGGWVDFGLCDRILKSAEQIARLTGGKVVPPATISGDITGLLVALAYPDRIAQRRKGGSSDYLLVNGRGAYLNAGDPLARHEFLAIADLDGQATRARVFSAAVLERADIESWFADIIETQAFVRWDLREEAVTARKQRKLGEIILKDSGLDANPDEMIAAVTEGIRSIGLEALPWTDELKGWQRRVLLLKNLMPEGNWPDVSDDHLLASLPDWLAPYLTGITRRAQFGRIDLAAALHALLDWNQTQALEKLAPSHIAVPSGSRIPIDYTAGLPVLAVRLQEMFGLSDTPAIAGGKLPLMLHLLSPARRPVQITRDLKSFWASAYAQVKSDLKGRYPKHYWPDNPLLAEPTARAKRRGA
jgi:ATP-dependent helicase HrpB